MTPGQLDLLSLDLTAEQCHGLAGLVIAAGDRFTSEVARRWIQAAGVGGTAVATEYGPTEITIGNSGQPVTTASGKELVPLGKPIPNTTMYVLGDRLQPAPVGVPGEICIGGAGVARGYLGNPGLTASCFIADPYGPPGSRLYRSGDRARWQPDGSLEFLGRNDHQIKIRGYRIEISEVVTQIRGHGDVSEVVVVPFGTSLAAFLVPVPGRVVDVASIRGHLAINLPEYMIPTRIISIDRIPLTTNGKVDARTLLSMLESRSRR